MICDLRRTFDFRVLMCVLKSRRNGHKHTHALTGRFGQIGNLLNAWFDHFMVMGLMREEKKKGTRHDQIVTRMGNVAMAFGRRCATKVVVVLDWRLGMGLQAAV